ncbi:MAG: T9SS type A sorting domain-containing protein [Bacteroidetes bacterium]|nr:T9SS type A sorting domain-containing protein [Bacteroidota bacterium]
MKALKHIVLSAAAIFAATAFSFAQSYSITPNDTFKTVGFMEDLETLTISQLNKTSDSIFLKWKKVSVTMPSNWEATICDNRVCYTELVDSGFMNPVLPTETGFLLLHITAHVNYGTAIIRYAVWDVATPLVRDTVTFIMTVNSPSSISETENQNSFNIFPNPVADKLNLTVPDKHNLAIWNSNGEKIYSSVVIANCELSTANFVNGIYIISISDNNKFSLTKKIIVQH